MCFLHEQNSLSGLNRGWRTPDPEVRKPGEGSRFDDDDKEGGGIFQRMGLKKTPTLDWRLRPGGPIPKDLEERQEKSLMEMKSMSDQKWTEKQAAEQLSSDSAHDAAVGRKATFQQCVFNMTNMLMVR